MLLLRPWCVVVDQRLGAAVGWYTAITHLPSSPAAFILGMIPRLPSRYT